MGRDYLTHPHHHLTPAQIAAALQRLRDVVGQSEPCT